MEAGRPLYFEPILEPERATPPGKGMMMLGILVMAAIARSAAARTVRVLRPMIRKLPPPTPRVMPT